VIFEETGVAGVAQIDLEPVHDERGFFARCYSSREFERRGLGSAVVECSISFNAGIHTLRGMHFQDPAHGEAKLIRCIRGRIWDVALDLRPDSPTFRHWAALELGAERRNAVFIPPGVAHGFLTLEPDSEVLYQMSSPHCPEAARGVRWDDPAFGIEWPYPPLCLSRRDAQYPDFRPHG
jgi:dTDP-4-dehydrorhamnose 3,5-epimerase